MKNLVLIGIFLLTAARMSGQTQVLTVDTSGNVTANGAVSGNGLNSQGSAGDKCRSRQDLISLLLRLALAFRLREQ